MDIMLDPQATPLEMTQFRCRVAFVLLPLEHASVSVLAMFHANCHMPPVQHHKWPVKRKCSGGWSRGMGMVSSWPEVVPPSANANDFSTHKPISSYEYLRLKCDPFTGSWNNPPPFKTFKGSSCNRRRTRHSPKNWEIIIIISLCQPSESNKHHEIVSQSCELFSKVEQNKEHDLWIYLKQCCV